MKTKKFFRVAYLTVCHFLLFLSCLYAQAGGTPKEGVLDTPRLEVPKSGELQVAVKKIRDAYATDFKAAKNPVQKWNLAKKLDLLAQDTKDDAEAEYASASEAIALYASVGDVLSAFRVVDELAMTFNFNAISKKQELFAKAAKDGKLSALKRMLSLVGLKLAGDAAEAEEWTAASDISKLSLGLARPSHDSSVIKRATEQSNRYAERLKMWQKVVEARKKLATDAEDPEANETVGRYLCLVRQNWDTGLLPLSKGTNAELRAVASKDLATAKDVDSQLSTADAWWSVAEAKKGDEKRQLMSRVAYWYEQAIPNTSGLKKAAAEKRLEVAYEVMSGRSFQKITAEVPSGIRSAGTIDCSREIFPADLAGTFEFSKSWLVTFDFMPPHLNGGWHMVFFWGDGRAGKDPMWFRQDGAGLICAIEDTVGERGQAIVAPLHPAQIGKWINVKFVHDSVSQELELYINNRLVRKDALAITPQIDQAMNVVVGGTNDSTGQRFTGQVRNVWMGNIQ